MYDHLLQRAGLLMPFNCVAVGTRFKYIDLDWVKISDSRAYCLNWLVDTTLAPGDKVHLSPYREHQN